MWSVRAIWSNIRTKYWHAPHACGIRVRKRRHECVRPLQLLTQVPHSLRPETKQKQKEEEEEEEAVEDEDEEEEGQEDEEDAEETKENDASRTA